MPSTATLSATTQTLEHILRAEPRLQFAVLVGSRATGKAHSTSDWDIALQWQPTVALSASDWMAQLAHTETLRNQLAQALHTEASAIDLLDLHRANLAMRASVAEEGHPLAIQDALAWTHFLNRTWRDLEDFYWSQQHAA